MSLFNDLSCDTIDLLNQKKKANITRFACD